MFGQEPVEQVTNVHVVVNDQYFLHNNCFFIEHSLLQGVNEIQQMRETLPGPKEGYSKVRNSSSLSCTINATFQYKMIRNFLQNDADQVIFQSTLFPEH